jgi:hypothetical protein
MFELIRIYYIILFEPEDISNHLNGLTKKLLILHKIIISFFFSGSFILLKKKIQLIDLFLLTFLILIIYSLISMVSLMISSLYYNKILEFSDRYYDEPITKIKSLIEEVRYILDLGWLPVIFLVHFSIVSNYFNTFIIFFLGLILLLIWKFYIWWKGIQYHFEWDNKKSLLNLINNIIYIFLLPLLHLIFFSFLIIILFK